MHDPGAVPLVLYIPGLKPKPDAAAHRRELLRCLLTGIRRADEAVAVEIESMDAFALVGWTFDFYGERRKLALDLPDIESLLKKDTASEADIVTATSWRRRFLRWLFHVADYLPFIIPKVATEEVQVHLRDFFRYADDVDGAGEAAREKLKSALRHAADAHRPVLLLAHSMGSVIAFDALWQLSQTEDARVRVDLLITMGSPLGQKVIQRHLLGAGETGAARYPANIARWVNIAAVGELTAIDRTLRNDFAQMIALGLVPDIEDQEVFNYYRMHGTLNVHAEYGYLVNETTAAFVIDWWRAKRRQAAAIPDRDSA